MNMLTTEKLTMSSREISELTGKQHKNVMADIRKLTTELEIGLNVSQCPDTYGRMQDCYLLDRNTTICLVSGYNAKLRMAIIKRWDELENSNKIVIPRTLSEALQLAADQARLIEESKPKVEFHDTVTQSEHTYKYQEAGKKIQQRPNKFVEWLRNNGYIDKSNTPYQRYINQLLFKVHTDVSKHGHEYTQGRITTKGLSYFSNKLEGVKL